MESIYKLKKLIIFLILSGIFLASTWSLFRNDFFRVHDFTQGARIVEMAQGLKDGHFPVLWSSNLGYGYGMPLFEFYAPLPYYIVAIFYIFGFSLINSIKLLFILPTIFTIIGAYLLGKKLYGSVGGLIVSAAFTLAPYRALNLFVRGALSEVWGIMALPFILLAIIKTIKKEKYGWLLLVVSIFVLLLSHNLTALIFLPFSVIFGAGYLLYEFYTTKKTTKELFCTVSSLLGYYFLAFSLSAFYTLPAFIEKNFTRLESTIINEYFDYNLHFLYIRQFFTNNWGFGGSTYGPMDDISFYLGFGQLFGLFLSGYLFFRLIYLQFKKKSFKKLFSKSIFVYLSSLFLLVLALLLTTAKTKFIWDSIELLKFLQFPWRYLSATIIFLSLAIGSITTLLPNKIYRVMYGLVLVSLLIGFNTTFFQPEKYFANTSEYYYSDVNKLRLDMSKTLPDYIPSVVTQDVIEPVALEGQVLYCQVTNNCFDTFSIITNKVHKKIIEIEVLENKLITFTIADFPGWQVNIDGVIADKLVSKEGFIQVEVPAGNHLVKVEFTNTKVRLYSIILTSISFISLAFLLVLDFKKNKKLLK